MAVKAKESPQVQKARRKIKRQLKAAERKMNPETLKAMSQLIKQQLARHQSERINLRKREFTIFDENQHPAKTESKFIMKLLHDLEHGEGQLEDNHLEGRITRFPEEEDS